MRTLTATLASCLAAAGLLFGASHLALSNGKPAPAAPTALAAQVKAAEAAPQTRLWADPPARQVAEAPAPTAPAPTAPAPGAASPVQLAAQAPARPAIDRAAGAKRADQARKRAMAQQRTRRMAARLASISRQNPPAPAQPAAPRPVDPITDLLHGLGIGREG